MPLSPSRFLTACANASGLSGAKVNRLATSNTLTSSQHKIRLVRYVQSRGGGLMGLFANHFPGGIDEAFKYAPSPLWAPRLLVWSGGDA